jgi:uncharacterized membrane protein HdeD (DUF308 family)
MADARAPQEDGRSGSRLSALESGIRRLEFALWQSPSGTCHRLSPVPCQENVMSELPQTPIGRALRHEIAAIHSNWLWFVILGIALIVLGTIALGAPVVASLATTLVLGSLFLVSGLFEVVGAFWSRHWSGTLIVLLSGILTAVLGFVLLSNPRGGTSGLTVLIASFLFVSGIFKVVAALSYRVGAWIWLVFSGAIDVLLALLIWRTLPSSGLVLVGVLVGFNLIVRGVTWIMIGLSVRRLSVGKPVEVPASSAG